MWQIADLVHSDHPIMAVQVSGDTTCSDDEDLALVDATISNRLPCVRVRVFRHNLIDSVLRTFLLTKLA